MPENEFFVQVKEIAKRVPGTQTLNKIRHDILRIQELSTLIKENKIVVLHPYSKMASDEPLAYEIFRDVVKDLLRDYGVIRLRRTTAAAIESPECAILMYAPLALLRIPSSHEDYLAQIGSKTRNMIRKAEKNGYEFKEFVWNDYLEDIFAINTSKEIRQSEPMRDWYRKPVQPRNHTKEELQYLKYYGAFKDGKLYAYLHIVLCGDFGFFRHFIGHAQHLTYGIMDGLLSWAVRDYAGNSQIPWFKYGELSKEPNSMHSFRKHAGFQGYATLLDLESDPEILQYSAKKFRTLWRI
jgi:hypothetical protein